MSTKTVVIFKLITRSQGAPILRVEMDGRTRDYRPGEKIFLLNGLLSAGAAEVVASWGRASLRTKDERQAAAEFLRQYPSGPQINLA